MKKLKLTIKLIDVEHKNWYPYMFSFAKEFGCTMTGVKDTYWCETTEKGYDGMMQIKALFELQNKIIIVKKEII